MVSLVAQIFRECLLCVRCSSREVMTKAAEMLHTWLGNKRFKEGIRSLDIEDQNAGPSE